MCDIIEQPESFMYLYKPYGKHFDYDRNLPSCMIGGNMCDECFHESMKIDREQQKQYYEQLARARLGSGAHLYSLAPRTQRTTSGGQLTRNPKAKSIYELTLTLPDTNPDHKVLSSWLEKFKNSKIFGVISLDYCYELTEKGVPHVHALVQSNKKYLDATKFKYPHRFELKRVRNFDQYVNYIVKEKDNNLVIEFCRANNIQQFSWDVKPDSEIGRKSMENGEQEK